jgi:hypothetical protein
MHKNVKVKVIKKDDRAVKVAAKPENANKKAAAREMVSTVADWVNDFQRRKRDETQDAIKKFFATGPQPNEL